MTADDEVRPLYPVPTDLTRSLPPVAGALALDWRPSAVPPPVPHLRLVPLPPVVPPEPTPDPLPQALRDPAGRLLQALADVHAGLRPAHQVLAWTSPEVYRSLLRRQERQRSIAAASHGSRRPQVRVLSVRVCVLDVDVAEVSAVVARVDSRGGRRVGAVAARMERREGAWRATAFEC